MSSTTIEIIRNKIINYFEDYFKENNLGKADEKTVQLIACFSNKTALLLVMHFLTVFPTNTWTKT